MVSVIDYIMDFKSIMFLVSAMEVFRVLHGGSSMSSGEVSYSAFLALGCYGAMVVLCRQVLRR